jgi:hypothetical protein
MQTARRRRLQEYEPDPAQASLFPDLPLFSGIQPPARLTEFNVARAVPPGRPGVYLLKTVGSEGRVSERVGRDRLDLRQRLLRHAREAGDSVLFCWMLAQDAEEAYRLECCLWHAQGGAWARIEGDAHPIPAERIPFLGCPDCEE